MARVQLENLCKVYPNGYVGVDDASFEVADGELMVLVGPSGCGKSTVLRMIAGLETITSGTLRIGERVVNAVPARDRDIAMVFQSYALYPHMTVAGNLAFGLKLRHTPTAEIRRRVDEAARLLGLESLLDKLPRQLSGGQRQRVALGRAMVRQSAVFLLDEPLSNLDAKLRQSVRADIARLHRELGTTMIYVTHDQVEAMTLGQRIVVIDRGRIQQIDTPMNLYRRPGNVFVAGFLGSPAMNLLRGRLQVADGGLQLRLPDGPAVPLGAVAVPDDWLGRERVVGVRPEHLQPAAAGGSAFPARIEMIEPVGNETFVNLSLGTVALAIRVPPQPLPDIGQPLQLAVQPQTLHFFDPDSGLRLEPQA